MRLHSVATLGALLIGVAACADRPGPVDATAPRIVPAPRATVSNTSFTINGAVCSYVYPAATATCTYNVTSNLSNAITDIRFTVGVTYSWNCVTARATKTGGTRYVWLNGWAEDGTYHYNGVGNFYGSTSVNLPELVDGKGKQALCKGQATHTVTDIDLTYWDVFVGNDNSDDWGCVGSDTRRGCEVYVY